MKVFAIIPSGGKGLRSGSATPKQYIKFNGKELIAYTFEVFQKNSLIDNIIVSANPSYFNLLEKIKIRYKLSKVTGIIEGGEERQDSVFNALKSIRTKKKDLIVVHDAARPLLPGSVLTDALLMAKRKGNAVVCLNARDTLITGDNTIRSYLNRDEVYYVQTPQIFYYGDLMEAMSAAYNDNYYGTDESMLVSRIGKKINISAGSFRNFKVTTADDIALLRKLLKNIK